MSKVEKYALYGGAFWHVEHILWDAGQCHAEKTPLHRGEALSLLVDTMKGD